MPIPTLEFFEPDWIALNAKLGTVQFRVIAKAPSFGSIQVRLFARQTGTTPWSKIGEGAIDNVPETLQISHGIAVPLKRGFDFAIHFAGRGHVLEPGFNSVSLGFDLSHDQGPVHNFGGSQTANARACGIVGNAFIRCQ